MIYPDVSAEAWAKKWGLQILEGKAHPCGCLLRSDKPFRDKDYVGLEAGKCCDKGLTTCSSVRPVSKSETAAWDNALSGYMEGDK